ncbi:helix-turn-helix transcriptional regulator [Paenibacillus uliginis]|uniref:helix-turn-helix transcriptional regulator n=1 Tax=Paenibacillus uliginis TaxID=683737 RepID=UPI001AD7ECB7|nr:helix-turn-helix domain-containing protein [Paenibacillus uliginis]
MGLLLPYNKKKQKKQNSVYVIFVLSYVSILILTLSSAFVYYAKINKQITMQTELSTVTLLGQLKSDIEDDISYIKELSNAIVFNSKLEQVAKGVPSYSYAELMKDMSSKQKPRDFLFDYFVYINSTDEIITPTIKMKAQKFFDLMYQFVDLDYETFNEDYLHGYHFQEYMPIQKMNQYESNMVDVLPYIQSFPMNAQSEPLGQVIFLMDASNMFSLINQVHQVTNSNIYVLDEKDRLILSSPDVPPLNVQKLDSFDKMAESRHEILNKIVSEKNGWKYIASTPKSLYFKENLNYLMNFIAIFLIYLVAGLIVVRYLAKRSYKPLKEINELIQIHAQTSVSGKNEYENIKKTIVDQIQNDKELNEIIEKQLPIVRRDYLLHLIRGMVTNYDDVAQQLSSIGIEFTSNMYLIGSLEIDMDSPFFMDNTNLSEKNLSLARVVAENVSCELMKKHFTCYFLDLGRNQSMFLIQLRDDFESAEAVSIAREQANALIHFTYRHYHLNLNVGLSTAYSELKNIPKCFDEAKKALEHSKLRDDYETMSFEDLGNLSFDYFYSMESEHQLINLLKSGHYEQAKQFLDNIFEVNISKNIGVGAAKLLLYEVASTLMKVMNFFLVAKGEVPSTNEHVIEEMIQHSSMEVAKRRFMETIDKISVLSENKNVSKTEKLVNRIAEYINQHAGETWLDLNMLSQEFEVTPQYISNVFKKYKQENVKDYIAKLKLNIAKELLESTDLPVREIASRLGYASEAGIIRLFKKYEGMTPGDYRLDCKSKEMA